MRRTVVPTFLIFSAFWLSCDGGTGKSAPGTGAGGQDGAGGDGSAQNSGPGSAGRGSGGQAAGTGGSVSSGAGGTGGLGLGGGIVGTGGVTATDARSAVFSDGGSVGRDVGAVDGPVASLMGACSEMIDAATMYLAALTPAQRTAAQLPFATMRTSWAYVPPNAANSQGQRLDQIAVPAQKLGDAFVKTGLSDAGFMKAGLIQKIEAATQQGPYSIAIYGTPSATDSWGWRFQGHHLSLHFTVVRCTTISNTPSFWGSNPASGTMGIAAPLRGEEDLARALFVSLSAAQKMKAIVARPNMTTPTTARVNPSSPAGLLVSDLMPVQVDMLRRVIGEYVGNMNPRLAAVRLAEIIDAGLEKIGFAWSGSAMAGEGHYYRVQGPTFLIEYDNLTTAPAGNHIHAVWRDFNRDFGVDVLKRHYQDYPHEPSAVVPRLGPSDKRTLP